MSESKRPRGKYKTTNWADYNASLDEVEIIIGINGSHQNADAIVFDYGMENEKITVRLKKALVFFFLADWNIAPLEYPHLPETLFPLKVIEVKEIE